MTAGKALRLRRLSSRSRTVIVAIDHGLGAGPMPGLASPVDIVKMCEQHAADGVLLTPGLLEQVARDLERLSVILRLDGGNTAAGPGGPMRLFTEVEQALAMGVDAVAVNATVGAPYEVHELEKLGRVAAAGRRWGLPVIGGMLTYGMLANHYDYPGTGDSTLPTSISSDVALAARIGAELGADVVKTRYCGDPDAFRRSVAAAGVPVMVAGGPMRGEPLEDTLRMVEEVLGAGASGVVFGRCIWSQPDPGDALKAVCAMVHEDATVEEALELAYA